MSSQLTYKCTMKEWELVKRFSSPQTIQLGAWLIICNYHKTMRVNPKYKTIKNIEISTYRHYYMFHVSCSDSCLKLTYIRKRFITAFRLLISLSLIVLSIIGIISGSYGGLSGGILGGIFGISICALITVLEIRLEKKAFFIVDEYIQKHIL